MRFCNAWIRYFLLIYFCYSHDLNHADPVTVKQSESPVNIDSVSKTIETTNVQKNDNTVDPRFQATPDLKIPVHEAKPNEQQVKYTTPPVDISLQNRVPISIQNDLTSPSTPVQPQTTQQPIVSSTIKTIPISNDNLHPKIIPNNVKPQINPQPVDTIQQKRSEEIPKQTVSGIQSQQPEQVKPISDNIPSPSNTQQPISNTVKNSNSVGPKPDQLSQVPLKPTETIPSDTSTVPNESHIPASTPPRILRSASHIHPRHVQQQAEDVPKKDAIQSDNATVKQFNDEHKPSIESSTKPGEPPVETTQQTVTNQAIENKSQPQTNDQNLKPVDNIDLPRQVRVHDSTTVLDQQNTSNVLLTKENSNKSENLTLNKEIENSTTIAPVLIHDTSAHLPRLVENDERQSIINSTIENSSETNDTSNETNESLPQIEPQIEDSNNSITSKPNPVLNNTDKNRQICWRLPDKFEPSIELLENQIFRFINVLPEFMQTIFFGRIDDREVLINTMWLGSICTMCILFSFLFLSMGAKRLKQSKNEKEVRARCQQLQQYSNQIELERATFERQNQRLSDEIDELKNLHVRDADEDIFALREECTRYQEDLKTARIERDTLQQNIDYKQSLLQKHEYDMQRQMETVAHFNNEILQLKRELEKERAIVARMQSNDISLERFEKSQEIIQELKSQITQLKQENFIQKDQLQEIQDHTNQLDIDNNQLTHRMKQLKDLLEQRDQTIKRIHDKINEDKPNELEDLLSIITENSSTNNQHLLSTIDNDLKKSNQHIRDLHQEIDEKTRRIKELDLLFKQEKDRCREMETKLKIVLELRERDAHLHIRQLGQTDAELRKARTDTERVRILQQQLELKQQQLDDVQKVLSSEQIKFNEEGSKLQHETHEKWMEVKRLTRELEVSKKECENLRKHITKYGNNERSSQEKTVIKPIPQHFGNNGELQINGSSPMPYQQGENFRPIDYQRNDSGATSPAEMFMPRPPLFGLPRPPFYPPPFMHPPPPNAYMMHQRYPMPTASPHGMISPISHLIINGNDANNSQIVDSSNITPNSTSHDAQSNGGAVSPAPDNEKQVKEKKAKKSLKKKTRTSTVKEDV